MPKPEIKKMRKSIDAVTADLNLLMKQSYHAMRDAEWTAEITKDMLNKYSEEGRIKFISIYINNRKHGNSKEASFKVTDSLINRAYGKAK